jgi:hypothetical protein
MDINFVCAVVNALSWNRVLDGSTVVVKKDEWQLARLPKLALFLSIDWFEKIHPPLVENLSIHSRSEARLPTFLSRIDHFERKHD